MGSLSVDEMFERVRALISDRNTSELDRLALEGLLRMAQRGRHISSERFPAITTAVQSFIAAREALAHGKIEAGQARLAQGLEAIAASAGPVPEEKTEK